MKHEENPRLDLFVLNLQTGEEVFVARIQLPSSEKPRMS